MNPDLPNSTRTMNSFWLGLNRVPVDWKFDNTSLQVDTNSHAFSVAGDVVMRTKVVDYKMQIEWVKAAWGAWPELVEACELKALIQTAQEKLSQAQSRLDKGKGKRDVRDEPSRTA